MISKKTDLLKWVKIGSVRYRTMDSFKGESSEKAWIMKVAIRPDRLRMGEVTDMNGGDMNEQPVDQNSAPENRAQELAAGKHPGGQ